MRATRTFRRYCSLALLLAFVLCLVDAIFIEPGWLQIERLALTLPRLPGALDGFTVLQITDVHYPRGLPEAYFRSVVATANALHPDIIVLTGDYAPKSARDAEPCARVLSALRAPNGVYAVLGNHDHWTDATAVTRALTRAGIPVLRNRAVPINRRGARLWVVGVDDVCEGKANLPNALRAVPAGEATILLAHEPDFADTAARYPIDVQLSGHSHGGLVWMPGIGTPLLPRLCRKYPRGLYHVGTMPLYTSRGVGVIPIFGLPVRFNCRPEITLFTLHAAR